MARRERGFTLLELMISTAVMAVVIGYLFQTFSRQQRTYVVVDQVTEAQQNGRVVSDLLERDGRMAGYLTPKAAAVCAHDRTTAPDTLFVSDVDVLRRIDQLRTANPDALAGNQGAPLTAAVGFVAGPNISGLTLQRDWVDVAADGADFATGRGVILVDVNDANGRVACGVIRSKVGNVLSVDFGPTSIGPIGSQASLLAVPAHVYAVTAGPPTQLQRDGLVLANDVEDLQVALFTDINANAAIDPGEFRGDGVAANYDATGVDGDTLREVRVSVVIRTREQDPNLGQGRRQTPENRALTVAETANDVANPGFRRRVHTAVVRLRNVGRG